MIKSSMKTTMEESSPAQTAQSQKTITDHQSELEQKKKELRLLTLRQEMKEALPHLYGFNLYKWQRDYVEAGPKGSKNPSKINLVCAANQIGKSACNILKMITWATDQELWPKLWSRRPTVFWYLLPTKDNLTTEFKNKWVKEFLPRNGYENHPQFGWRAEFRNKHLWAIYFKSGVTVYVHSYAQDKQDLQGATLDAIFADEEVPWELMPELLLRINERDGYWNGVMTPTIGQDYWRRCFEVKGSGEVFPEAFKQSVSLYDCRVHEDGTTSQWTDQRIIQTLNRLGSQQQIDLRVHGKFVAQEGLKIPSFSRERNIRPAVNIPNDWLWYSGVDIGSGNGSHNPAIAFVAVRPDFQAGRVVHSWVGTDANTYTATDILSRYIKLRAQRTMAGEFYDWSSKDFGTVASRSGLSFQMADKNHDVGFPMLNTLFKNQMLVIDESEENQHLVNELISLRHSTNKSHAKDDAIDSVRYAITKIPWSFEGISGEKIIPSKPKQLSVDEQRMGLSNPSDLNQWEVELEMDEWASILDPDFDSF